MEQWLRGAGEIGRDLARLDWDENPLGPPNAWPPSLQSCVRMLLASRFSMWLAWGPDLRFFCNDAYRQDTLGTKYPWALGRPAREVWSEIWPQIEPRISRVVATGEATWDQDLRLFLERSGYVEETYHTFSYSPLADDAGRNAGMLCVVAEVTDEVVSRRRIGTLTALGIRSSETLTVEDTVEAAADALALNGESLPFTLIYLIDDEARVARLRASTGFKGEHPMAPPVLALDDARLWPVPDLLRGGSRLVTGIAERFTDVPTGAWSEPPISAYAMPLGASRTARPTGFMVVGLNRYRPFEGRYREFLDLVAGQVVNAVDRAGAYETERERAEELERLDAAKTTFFTNVSHELRTPLTLLLGPIEDALTDVEEPLGERQRQRARMMLRNAQRLLKLVNTLLDFSALESQRAATTFAATDLAAYTAELAEVFRPAVTRAGLTLRVDCPPLSAPVYVDRDLWAKVVFNLMSNALKFTFAGELSVSVTMGRHTGGWAELRVSDTGTGITDADQRDLFKRFHRVLGARSRSHEGTGVGLALVSDIAALHGGEATVVSRPGEGSTFVVRIPPGAGHLPADRVADTSGDQVSPADRATGYLEEATMWLEEDVAPKLSPDAGGGRATVLVVDDNRDMRQYIAGLLQPMYDVQVASDGLEALAKARSRLPDLVVTDVMMPRLDGFALMRELAADPQTTGVPVLMVSARPGDDGAAEGLEAGADDYLMKPFSSRELKARVRANLELDRARRTRSALERSQGLLQEAQRLAQVGSWEIDLGTGEVKASAELLRIIGMSADELASEGTAALVERLVHPDDLPLVRDALEAAMAGSSDFDARLLRGDGTVQVARVRAEVRRDEAGRPVALLGSLQDITEQEANQQELAAARAASEVSEREHTIAAELQRSLLPRRVFDVEHLEIATFYRSGVEGTEVGGDWFDVVDLGAGRAALVIGDVMGRGVRAAAVMGQLRSASRAYARLDLPPAQVLHHLDGIVRDLGEDQIVTCVYAVFDAKDQALTIGNAGHLPPLLVREGRGVHILGTAGGPPLGAGPSRFEEQRVQMVRDAMLVLYTDGLVERRGTDIDDGLSELARLLDRWRGDDIEKLPETLVEGLLPEGQDDDVAVLIARMAVPAGATVLSERLPSDESAPAVARRLVRARLDREGVSAALAADVVLVTSELVTNAVRHGSPPVELQVRTSGDAVVLEVRDSSADEPVMGVSRPDAEGGRGLRIVQAIAVEWGTRSGPGSKSVWCVLRQRPLSSA